MTKRITATLPLAISIGVLAARTEFSLNFTFHWFTAGDLGNGLALPNNFHLILPAAFVSGLLRRRRRQRRAGQGGRRLHHRRLLRRNDGAVVADGRLPGLLGIAWVGVFALVLVVLSATGDWHYVPATFGAFAAVFFGGSPPVSTTGSRTEAASATAWKLADPPPPVPGPSVVSCRRPTHGCGSTSRSPCSAAVLGIAPVKLAGLIGRLFKSDRTVAEADVSVASAASTRRGHRLIFIAAKFRVWPADADAWPEIVRPFTDATRAEPGCPRFEWSQRRGPQRVRPRRSVRPRGCWHRTRDVRTLCDKRKGPPAAPRRDPANRQRGRPGTEWSLLGELAVDAPTARSSTIQTVL